MASRRPAWPIAAHSRRSASRARSCATISALGERLVELCTTHVPRALFSAAHPGQHGFGHVNAQPRGYWIERFKARGFRLDPGATEGLRTHLKQTLTRGFWLADNVFLMERSS